MTQEDFTISPALTNVNKTFVVLSMRSGDIAAPIAEIAKSWEIVDENTFRIYGSEDVDDTNKAADFVAYVIELSGPIYTQKDFLQYFESDDETLAISGIKEMNMSPLNITNSFHLLDGFNIYGGEGTDPTFGREEFFRTQILDSDSWEINAELHQDSVETQVRAQLIDFNDDSVLVQRGVGSFTGLNTTITPATAIDREDSLLFVTHRTNNTAFGWSPDISSISAYLDSSNDIILEREAATDSILFSWEIITFLDDSFVSVTHGIHSQSGGTLNATEAVTVNSLSNSFAIGTEGNPFCYCNGRGSSTIGSGYNATMGTIELQDTSTVRFVRDDSTGTWDVGYQVIEFSPAVADPNDDLQWQPSCCFFYIMPDVIQFLHNSFNKVLFAVGVVI